MKLVTVLWVNSDLSSLKTETYGSYGDIWLRLTFFVDRTQTSNPIIWISSLGKKKKKKVTVIALPNVWKYISSHGFSVYVAICYIDWKVG